MIGGLAASGAACGGAEVPVLVRRKGCGGGGGVETGEGEWECAPGVVLRLMLDAT